MTMVSMVMWVMVMAMVMTIRPVRVAVVRKHYRVILDNWKS